MTEPRISVVIPTRNRPVRLLWLLNALSEQTLDRERFEVIVVDDASEDAAWNILAAQERRTDLHLRVVRHAQPRGPAAARNSGWSVARAPVIAFTDDDCRPTAEYLAGALAAAEANPGAVVQGATLPDPDEAQLLKHAPHARSMRVKPPTPWAETCNIIYPRELLERLNGFNEGYPQAAGEDTDLAARAKASGARFVGAPEVLTYHAVVDGSLLDQLRASWRWQHVPFVFKRHPELREDIPLWIFWKRRHAWFPGVVAAVALERRNAAYALLALPWILHAMPDHTTSPRGRLRSFMELPGVAMIDIAEMLACVRGSIRYRTLLI